MSFIRQYLLSVISAAIICSIVIPLVEKKGAYTAVVKLLCGLFLVITVISPLASIKISDFSYYFTDIEQSAQDSVSSGQQTTQQALSAIIKSESESYILDKASSMGLNIAVEVTTSNTSPPVPAAITLTGTISPYEKQKLAGIISGDLGIPEDMQVWN